MLTPTAKKARVTVSELINAYHEAKPGLDDGEQRRARWWVKQFGKKQASAITDDEITGCIASLNAMASHGQWLPSTDTAPD
jgi:hypothetical protein